MYRKISEGREKLVQEVNKLMEIKYAAKTVYLFHMTLIVIDSIRIQFILFLHTAYSMSAVVFIKSIPNLFSFVCC